MRIKNTIVMVLAIMFLGCSSKRNGNFSDIEKTEYDRLTSKIIERLSLGEFHLSDNELCYLKPTLDSLYSQNRVVGKEIYPFKISQFYLAYLRLTVTAVKFEKELFLFTSLIERDLIDFNNTMYEKEFLPSEEDISDYADLIEFRRFINSFQNSELLGGDIKSKVIDLVEISFQKSDGISYNEAIFSEEISSILELKEWKNTHLGKFKDMVKFQYENDRLFLPISIFGMISINYQNNFETKLIKSVYPNNITIMDTYDAGDFYLKECDK